MIRLSNVRGFGRLRRAAGVIGLPPILSILPRRRCPSSRSRLDVCDGDEVDDEVDVVDEMLETAIPVEYEERPTAEVPITPEEILAQLTKMRKPTN